MTNQWVKAEDLTRLTNQTKANKEMIDFHKIEAKTSSIKESIDKDKHTTKLLIKIFHT